jgi:hypothetical protein
LPREVANIKIQRAGASVSEFCIELHPAADLGVSRISGKGAWMVAERDGCAKTRVLAKVDKVGMKT